MKAKMHDVHTSINSKIGFDVYFDFLLKLDDSLMNRALRIYLKRNKAIMNMTLRMYIDSHSWDRLIMGKMSRFVEFERFRCIKNR